jgi:uncharacterized protein (DUF58 family)
MKRVFVAYLVGLVIVALVGGVGILLTATYIVAGTYLLSRAWMRRSVPALAVDRRFTNRAFPGDVVEVELHLRNDSRLPIPWVELYERLPTALAMPPSHREVLSLAPHEERTVAYSLRPTRRGYHRLGPLSARVGDLLGITDEELRAAGTDELIVYPEIVPLTRLGLPSRSPLAAIPATTPLHTDPARIAGIRDYLHGDPERRIHWSATAKAGRLLVKQFEPTSARDTVVCLDFDRRSYPAGRRITSVELAVTVAASITHHVTTLESQPAGLLTEAHDPHAGDDVRFLTPIGARRQHLAVILEILARIQPTRATPLGSLLQEASVALPWGSTLAVVSGRASPSTLAALYRLKRTGFLVSLILVGQDEPEEQRRAEALGITTHRVHDARELETIR